MAVGVAPGMKSGYRKDAMIDIIKKTLLAGIGAVVVTREKIEGALDEFVRQGKVTSDEARQMAEKIAADGRREFDTMSQQLNDLIRERFSRADQKYQDRINALEARVTALEQAKAGAATAPGGASEA
jgi:polyhydroxyalkanoate synthesis regulator phasin